MKGCGVWFLNHRNIVLSHLNCSVVLCFSLQSLLLSAFPSHRLLRGRNPLVWSRCDLYILCGSNPFTLPLCSLQCFVLCLRFQALLLLELVLFSPSLLPLQLHGRVYCSKYAVGKERKQTRREGDIDIGEKCELLKKKHPRQKITKNSLKTQVVEHHIKLCCTKCLIQSFRLFVSTSHR